MRIYLIGYMGSGKSKTAFALGKILNYPVYEMDAMISQEQGKSINEIFSESGEEYFRELERVTLHHTIVYEDAVISTGGGTPCFFDNMEWMKEHGVTVYLEANAGLLFHRLSQNRAERPLLAGVSDIELMELISGHLAVRTPFYSRADLIIPAASLNVKELRKQFKIKN